MSRDDQTSFAWVVGASQRGTLQIGTPQSDRASGQTRPEQSIVRQYEIVKFLGDGASSTVYAAEDLINERDVVLKVSSPSISAAVDFLEIKINDDMKQLVGTQFIGNSTRVVALRHSGNDDRIADQFLCEIRALQSLKYPGIVRLLDYFAFNGATFLALERIKGRTLEAVVVEKSVVSLNSSLRFLEGILKTLRFMHAEGFIHRDIKPQNIMITQYGLPMIIDFGTAVPKNQLKFSAHALTPGFSAPEALNGPEYQTEVSDIFSAFSTALWALTKERVNAQQTFHRSRFKFSDAPDRDTAGKISDFFSRGLQPAFQDRFQSASEAIEELSKLRTMIVSAEPHEQSLAPDTPVFISYSSEDRNFCQNLVDLVRKAGMKPWVDEEAIPGGMKWAQSIETGLKTSKVFFLLCTPHSVGFETASEFVVRELHRAIDLRVKIVPILFPEVRLDPAVEWLLSGIQALDVRKIDFDRPELFNRLIGN